ncbi:hypothetical protein V8C43DRAFT_297987 [Trichoderma afarasin]|uniref:Uncharacterized protein n=1 Tax=Trichoderma lentiforme TaxID=1567552 RepID=A0A9P4XEQ8_9HYPO|nr:hypothetical protein CFAM422_005858 [Trichoderma lentiforme]
MAEASSPSAPAASNASKRLREDGEAIKSRLLDQHFHISKWFSSGLQNSRASVLPCVSHTDREYPLRQARYVDPLVPRKTSDPQNWPRGVTPEMEQKWLAIIKEHRSTKTT